MAKNIPYWKLLLVFLFICLFFGLLQVKSENDKKIVSLEKLNLSKNNSCVFKGIKSHLNGGNIIRNKHLNSIKHQCQKIEEEKNNPAYQEQLKVLKD